MRITKSPLVYSDKRKCVSRTEKIMQELIQNRRRISNFPNMKVSYSDFLLSINHRFYSKNETQNGGTYVKSQDTQVTEIG